MTAWRLGEDARRQQDVRALDGDDGSALSFVGRVIEWIPADVVVLFAAAITAFQAEPTDGSAKVLIVGGVILAVVAVIGGAFAQGGPITKRVGLRAALAPIAFLIWSPSVPGSGWQDIDWIAEHPELTVLACAVAAFVFALIAQGAEKRLPDDA